MKSEVVISCFLLIVLEVFVYKAWAKRGEGDTQLSWKCIFIKGEMANIYLSLVVLINIYDIGGPCNYRNHGEVIVIVKFFRGGEVVFG